MTAPPPPPPPRAPVDGRYVVLAALDATLAGLGPRAARRLTKPLLMPVLAHGFATATRGPRGGREPARRATLAAQLLSGAGDVALLARRERAFLAGLTAFLAAHAAYTAGFVTLRTPEPRGAGPVRGPRLAAGTFLLTAPVLGHAAGRTSPRLRAPVVGYAATLCAMVGAASRVHGPTSARRRMTGGAALFLVSDGLLGTREFLLADGATTVRRVLDVAVMVTYTAAQGLIASGVADAVGADQAAGTAST